MISDAFYIDTRPEAAGVFAAPLHCDDYGAWLTARYQRGVQHEGKRVFCFGVAQRIESIIFQARDQGVELLALGPHAGAAARVIEKLSAGSVSVAVLA